MTESVIEDISTEDDVPTAVCITLTREEAIGFASQILRAVGGEENESEFVYCGADFDESRSFVESVTIIAPGYEIPLDEDGDEVCEDCDRMKREHAN